MHTEEPFRSNDQHEVSRDEKWVIILKLRWSSKPKKQTAFVWVCSRFLASLLSREQVDHQCKLFVAKSGKGIPNKRTACLQFTSIKGLKYCRVNTIVRCTADVLAVRWRSYSENEGGPLLPQHWNVSPWNWRTRSTSTSFSDLSFRDNLLGFWVLELISSSELRISKL